MREHKPQRIEVLDGSLRTATAAHVLNLSQRQVRQLIREVRAEGALAVRHKLRKWMIADGIWKSRAQRHRVHQP